MFGLSRAPVALVVAVVASVLSPVAAYGAVGTTTVPSSGPTTTVPSSGPTTTTTIPPPPAAMPSFSLPTNSGLELLNAMRLAEASLMAAQKGLGPATRGVVTARRKDAAARRELARLDAVARRTEEELEQTRDLLHQAAVEAYIHAGSADLVTALAGYLNTNSVVDAGSQLHVLGTFGSNESHLLDRYLALQQQVNAELAHIKHVSEAAARALQTAQRRVSNLHDTIRSSRLKIAVTLAGMHDFETAATSATSPILGPSRLTARQMADYVIAQHYKPNITVPIGTLAQFYLDEGLRTGVRGDVAFAQSILETAGFAHPGSAATDNNFAGIGWCDTCAHGMDFPDARTGVRAQLQLLRIYVDPKFPEATYKDPILLRGSLKLGFRGKVQTWWDLWGTWATGALYGQRVYDIYERMVAFAAHDPAPKVVAGAKPVAPAAPLVPAP